MCRPWPNQACPASRRFCTTGCWRPKGTPAAIIERLNAALRVLVATNEVKQRIAAEGGDPLISSPAEYDTDIDREATKWAGLISRLGLKVE